jgi:hypothetical protein
LLLFEFLVSLFKDQQEINNWKNYKWRKSNRLLYTDAAQGFTGSF